VRAALHGQHVVEVRRLHPAALFEVRQTVADEVAERSVLGAPHAERQAEAVLGLVDDLFREQVGQRLLEEPAQFLAAHLVVHRQMVGKRHHAVIEQGIVHLDAGRFGHRADLAQVVVGQGELQIKMHHAVDVMVRRGAFVDLGERSIRCRRIDSMDEIRCKNLVERGAVQEIVGLQSQRQADFGLGDVAF